MSIPYICKRNQQAGLMEPHASEGGGEWGQRENRTSWLQQNAKPAALPLAPQLGTLSCLSPTWRKANEIQSPSQILKPGFLSESGPRIFHSLLHCG